MPLNITKPTVGASDGAWGGMVNAAFDAVKTFVDSLEAATVSALNPSFGVLANGAADDRAALAAAAASAASFGVHLVLPGGRTYQVGSTLALPDGAKIQAGTGAVLRGSLNGLPLMTLGIGCEVRGLTINNTSTTDSVGMSVRGTATDVLVERCTFAGGVIGFLADSGSIARITLERCRFTAGSYGVLTNSGANDISNVKILHCDFTGIVGDPIEFNHPSASASTAADFLVQGCYINADASLANNTSSGFGVGAAGVKGLRVVDNTFTSVRNQAVHIEDDSHGVVVSGNTFRDIGDTDQVGWSAVVTVDNSVGVEITDNDIEGTNIGRGIWCLWDGSGGTSKFIIGDNRISGCTGDAVTISGDGAGVGRVSNNVIHNNGGNGVTVNPGAASIAFSDNMIVDNGGWGIYADTPAMQLGRKFVGNYVTGNTLGDYSPGTTAGTGSEIVLGERQYVSTTATWAATSTTAIPLMRAGAYATGTLTVMARANDGTSRLIQAWQVTWSDPASLTATSLKQSMSGNVSAATVSVVNGAFTLNLTNAGAAKTLQLYAEFTGTAIEDTATRSGTITPSAPPSYVRSVDGATPDTGGNVATRAASGMVVPPVAQYLYGSGPSAWPIANQFMSARFTLEHPMQLGYARLHVGTAAGNIEVSISSAAKTSVRALALTKLQTSGVIACPTVDGYGLCVVPFTDSPVLQPGDYVVSLWASSTSFSTIWGGGWESIRWGTAPEGGNNAAGITQADLSTSATNSSAWAPAVVLEPPTPVRPPLVLFGDSITAQQAWGTRANALAGSRYVITTNGHPGFPASSLISLVASEVVALAPAAVTVLAGTNDIGAVSASTTTTNLRTIYDAILAGTSATIVACTVPPRDQSAGVPLPAPLKADIATINAWILAQASSRIRVCNWSTALSTGDGVTPNNSYFADGIHPNAAGGVVMGDVLAPILP